MKRRLILLGASGLVAAGFALPGMTAAHATCPTPAGTAANSQALPGGGTLYYSSPGGTSGTIGVTGSSPAATGTVEASGTAGPPPSGYIVASGTAAGQPPGAVGLDSSQTPPVCQT